MIFRLACVNDLSSIKTMYEEIIENMNQNNICIWNEYYPFECFEGDINSQRLYVLEENDSIVAACALCDSNEAEKNMKWKNEEARALYIDRLGVNVNYQGKGYGSLVIKNVIEIARKNQFEYLRLFVVDINNPAICLYEKNRFEKLNGVYEEKINEKVTLKEYAYEMKI
ncbi:MAG: GNAT family N-acetyltransferase [Clostridia bacterium]|nr:GNAT family N-acetyltransferase [Clostridia bacterium]